MIVLGGFTRFPVFYSDDGRKRLGNRSNDPRVNAFVDEVSRASGKRSFVIFGTVRDLQYTSRFMLDKIALNPELRDKEDVPQKIHVIGSTEAQDPLTNALTRGIILKGGRGKVFIPMLSIRLLSKNEVNAFLGIADIKDMGLDRIKIFLQRLDIDVTVEKELPNQRAVLRLRDPMIDDPYKVLIDQRGRVLRVNFCADHYQEMFIAEIVMFVREHGGVNLVSGFDY